MDFLDIFEDLKERIIWLKLKPGATLNAVELSKEYGVSRTPVSIALNRLDAAGLVVRHGSQFTVSPLTVNGIREMTEIRTVLEMQANLWAMNRISPEGLDDLRAVRDETLALSPESSKEEILRLDVKFHRIIFRETQNEQLAQMLEQLLGQYTRFWLSGPQDRNPHVLNQDTLEIIRAIEEKDEVALRAATISHIKYSLDTIMGLSETLRVELEMIENGADKQSPNRKKDL